ncbi:MAG: PQQ-binding-like beta-propeller repeat protein [Planctomycetaceae bacterium]
MNQFAADGFQTPVSEHKNEGLRRRLPTALILLISLTSSVTFADNGQPVTVHGPLEFLRQTLVQSSEDARLIASAERRLSTGDQTSAFESLLAVFAHNHDAFTPLSTNRASSSAYGQALQLLRSAKFTVREEWTAAVEPLAAEALNHSADDSQAMTSIARRFPYTPSGLKAAAVNIAMAISRGQLQLASAMTSDLELQYAETHVSFDAAGTLKAIRERLKSVSRRQIEIPSRFAGQQPLAAPVSLNLPWPRPTWSWQESIWSTPELVNAFAGLSRPDHRSALSVNSWQPVLTEDQVILRTPARIVALDRQTGRELWSIETDTRGDVTKSVFEHRDFGFENAVSVEEILRQEEFGTVAVADSLLLFIDGFDPTERRFPSNIRIPGRRPNPADEFDTSDVAQGTRLVAVQLLPEPRILWKIGEGPPFNYRLHHGPHSPGVQTEGTDSISGNHVQHRDQHGDRDAADQGAEEGGVRPFEGHCFLGVPLIHDQQVYILSADHELVRLNCLTAASGRLLWTTPLVYLNDAATQQRTRFLVSVEKVPHSSLCGIDGDTVICALSDGAVIGVSISDGELKWATNLRPEPPNETLLGAAIFENQMRSHHRIGFRPLLQSSRMIWAAPVSTDIACLNTRTGELQWQVSRTAQGPGAIEGSNDHYAVGIQNDRVILVGDRHVRALSLQDGHQLWAAPSELRPVAPSAAAIPFWSRSRMAVWPRLILRTDVSPSLPNSFFPQPPPTWSAACWRMNTCCWRQHLLGCLHFRLKLMPFPNYEPKQQLRLSWP